MNNQQIGAVLMFLPQLWIAYKILRAKDGKLSINVFAIVIALACFVAGRLVAGQSELSMLLG